MATQVRVLHGWSRSAAAALALALSVAAPAAADVLYWIDTSYPAPAVRRANLDGSAPLNRALVPGSLPEGAAWSSAGGGRLFWAEGAWTNARILRADGVLSSVTPVLTGGSCLRGIAADAAAGKLYWTSSNLITGARLERANLDGSGVQTLVDFGPNLSNPRQVALDPVNGKVYWTDFDLNLVRRANLDGSSVEDVATASGAWGVAVDPAGGRLFWCDHRSGKLRRGALDGTGAVTVMGGLGNPTYMALDPAAGKLYWAEATAGAQRIRRANLDGTGLETVNVTLGTYGGLAIAPGSPVDVPDEPAVTRLELAPIAPNPARGSTTLALALPASGRVSLAIVDLAGRRIARVLDAELPAGRHRVAWDGRADRGPAAPGVYFAVLRMGGERLTRRFVLVER